jgi:hypothetical protein
MCLLNLILPAFWFFALWLERNVLTRDIFAQDQDARQRIYSHFDAFPFESVLHVFLRHCFCP